MIRRAAAWCAVVATLAAPAGCSPGVPDCAEDRCAGATSRQEVLDKLSGYTDPVAEYLRAAVDDRGTLSGDYRDILDGVAVVTGCSPDSERTFVPLSNVGYTPRPIAISKAKPNRNRTTIFPSRCMKLPCRNMLVIHVSQRASLALKA